MAPSQYLSVRDASSSSIDPTLRGLLIALIVLGFTTIILIATLYILRQVRKKRSHDSKHTKSPSELPLYECHRRGLLNGSRLTINTAASSKRESTLVMHEKEILMADSDSRPSSPVPEIRITFPEELDEKGKRHSRVVVVRVGDNGIGLEPVPEDLPAYQQHQGDRFHSLDLERIGGLKEKEMR